MLQLINRTPFAAERSILLDKDGNQIWVVIVKATYLIRRNADLQLHSIQEPPCMAPVYESEEADSSMLRECEMVYTHPGTDITLNATAYAPPGKRTQAVDVCMSVGRIRKALRVFGNRSWKKSAVGLKMTKPEYFSKMPIRYERAYGGKTIDQSSGQKVFDPRNPIGTGFALRAKDLIDNPVPNIQYPDIPMEGWKKRPAPAGFGAIYSSWSPRKEYAGTYDQAWKNERMPLWPKDFDIRYHQSAPTDQISPKPLRGAEWVILENLTPELSCSFRLPQVFITIDTQIKDTWIRQNIQLDRVIIEPDDQKLIMVWRSSLNCRSNARAIEKSIIDTKPVLTRK